MANIKYSGVIFDFNGTLLFDSEKHKEAWLMLSKKLRGYSFSEEELQTKMFGHTNFDIIKYLTGSSPDAETLKEITNEKEEIYRQMCLKDKANFALCRGSVEFLNFLTKNNIPRTIATMSEKTNVDFFIKYLDLEKWFDLEKIVFDDGTMKGKPDPEIYIRAAKKLNLNPKDCLVFEDAYAGIKSAESAGIGKIIAVASMESRDFYKKISAVSAIIDDFTEADTSILNISADITN